MSKQTGRNVALSPFRKIVVELMHHCKKVPSVTMERPMNLAPLIAARDVSPDRPSWAAIFLKAWSIVSARRPELRQSFLPYPWPHLYEHPINIANFTIERRYKDEDVVFFVQMRSPERRTLAQVHQYIQKCKTTDVEKVKFFRRVIRMTRVPWPVSRLAWWTTLNVLGKQRAHNFGTFTLTTTSGEGAGIQNLEVLLTSTLHYGLFDDRGNLPMRMTFDHRVFDGATAARAMVDLENVLHKEILSELRGAQLGLAA